MANAGVATWTAICFIVCLLITLYFAVYYSRPGTPPLAVFFTFIAWLAAFSVCYLVPIDLLPPATSLDLNTVWQVLFWISFCLMWFFIPFLSGYYDNGEFTPKKKAIASLKFNAILVVGVGLVGGVGIIYLLAAQKKSMSDVAGYLVTASNVWGLIMLIFLAGYGLVEFPRQLYYRSNLVRQRDLSFYHAASTHHEYEETRDEVIATFQLIRSWQVKVDSVSVEHPEYVKYFNEIQDHVREKEIELQNVRGNATDNSSIEELRGVGEIGYRDLVKLNYLVKSTLRHLSMVETQMRDVIDDAIWYDEAVGNQHENAPPASYGQLKRCWWYMTIGFRRNVFIVGAVLCGLLSFSILFAEITIPTHTQISPLVLIVNAARKNPLSEQIFTAIPIAYLSLCAYYPLFNMRVSKFYYIGKKRTDENTLLLNATFLLRVSVPLAYNFVKLLQIEETSLQAFTGVMGTIPFLGGSFNEWFPVCMAIVSFFTLIKITDWLLGFLGYQAFQYQGAAHHHNANNLEDETTEGIQEGRTVVNEYRRKRELELQRISMSPTDDDNLSLTRLG